MATKKRTREEWAKLIVQQRKSGQSQKKWCEENGINLHTFVDRVHRLHLSEKIQDVDFVEVKNKPQSENEGSIEVQIGAYRINVSGDFQEAAFIRVCKALMIIC